MDTTERLMEDMGIEHTKRFSCEELKAFTSDFSESLGSGGFGDVYKGKLPINGEQVAVKVLKGALLSDGIKDQLKAEMSVLCKVHHKNVVRLYGFCFESDMKALVYEFMENESLDKLLNGAQNIEWKTLLNIVIGTAKGLSYLHEDCQPNIIHYDIKPANILLDSKFSPKVGDFGLAKHLSQDKTHITESKVRGTFNPYSPITSKCDVYIFGMILFDIVGRTRSAEWNPSHVWKEFNQKREEKVMEECGIRVNDREEATRILLIALCCVQFYPELRPPMSRVLTLLEGREEIKMLSTNPFGHFDSFTPKNSASSSSSSLNRDPEGVSESKIMKHYEEKTLIPEICIMIGAKELEITWGDTPKHWIWTSDAQSRFPEVAQLLDVYWLDIRVTVDTERLAPKTMYAAYLVFKIAIKSQGLDLPTEVTVKFAGGEDGASGTRTVYLDSRGTKKSQEHPTISQMSRERGDGWMEVEMGEFDSDGSQDLEVEVSLLEKTLHRVKAGLIVEGIELRPKM